MHIYSIKCFDLPCLHNYDYHNNLWTWFSFHMYCTICRFLRERDRRVLLIIVLLLVLPVFSYVSSSDVSDWTMEAAINITSLRSKSTRRFVSVHVYTYVYCTTIPTSPLSMNMYVCATCICVRMYLLNGFIELLWIYLIVWTFITPLWIYILLVDLLNYL